MNDKARIEPGVNPWPVNRPSAPTEAFMDPRKLSPNAKKLLAYSIIHMLKHVSWPTKLAAAISLKMSTEAVEAYEDELRRAKVYIFLRED